MQNPFEQLKAISAGPHQDFEEAAWRIVQATESNVRRIAISQGDGGMDAAQGTWGPDGAMRVFQFKYFPDKLGDSQRRQITDSFARAKTNPLIAMKRWTLVLPARLRRECLSWFESWKASQDSDVEIELWDGDDLTERLQDPRCASARRFLIDQGVLGLSDGGPAFHLLARGFQANDRGVGFVVQVSLENSGEVSANNLRLVTRHTQTGCVSGAFDRAYWHQVEEVFMTQNPLKLVGSVEVHPRAPVPVYQIPLRAGEVFDVEVLLTISCRDKAPQHLYLRLCVKQLTAGTLVKGEEVTNEEAGEIERRLAIPRTPQRPQPTRPLAVELLSHIKAHPDESTRGLSLLRIENPVNPGMAMIIPTTKPGGREPMQCETADALAAIQELQELGWIGNPASSRVLHLYKFLPE